MPELQAWPGLVAACGIKYTDPQSGAKRARRWSPVMALAVWALARHIDPTGRGRVHLADLQRAGLELWTRDSFYRHLRDAQTLGLVRHTRRQRDGARMVACTGLARVAALLKLPSVGARKVAVPLGSLRSAKTFKRALWSAYHAGRSRNTGAPITRATLRQLAGLPESTQRAYECTTVDAAGYRVTGKTANAVILAPHASLKQLAAARENVHGGCFIDRHSGALHRRVGNSYSSSLVAGSRSRARKVNRLVTVLVSTAAGPTFKRLFFAVRADDAPGANVKRAERAARAGRAVDVPLTECGQAAGVVLWAPVWDSWSLAHVAGVA